MSAFTDYLNAAREGDEETAFFGLIDLGNDTVRRLQDAYHVEPDPAIRALILRVLLQYRDPDSVDFLAVALKDPNNEVWKLALDLLVTLASAKSRKVLEAELEHAIEGKSDYHAWLKEAISQIDEVINNE
jgi:HEAT repeat protein